jgi:glutamate-5-semialdehyde dehydrogenase
MSLNQVFVSVREASRQLNLLSDEKINGILIDLANKAVASTDLLLMENQKDLDRMPETDPKYDRLQLTADRIKGIANDMINVSSLGSPLGRIIDERRLNNGLEVKKVSVPLGVVGIIYEARPNVTFDVFSLCIKSGNACLLKGGSDAEFSNRAIVAIIKDVLRDHEVNEDIIALLPVDREATAALLDAVDFVDIIIPRGSQKLIDYVRAHAKVPVIETGAGIVHTYYDASADKQKGIAIVNNAKTRRVSVCNALDCLVIHERRLADLPDIGQLLAKSNVEIYADAPSYQALKDHYPNHLLLEAEPSHFGTEFLSYRMSIKTVAGLEEAIDHIHKHSSQHSEAIIAEDEAIVEQFLKQIDAAAVYANTSTAFTDGAQFGLGAEIGISTQKLHARGPMALEEMTSYKWIVRGDGQVRG